MPAARALSGRFLLKLRGLLSSGAWRERLELRPVWATTAPGALQLCRRPNFPTMCAHASHVLCRIHHLTEPRSKVAVSWTRVTLSVQQLVPHIFLHLCSSPGPLGQGAAACRPPPAALGQPHVLVQWFCESGAGRAARCEWQNAGLADWAAGPGRQWWCTAEGSRQPGAACSGVRLVHVHIVAKRGAQRSPGVTSQRRGPGPGGCRPIAWACTIAGVAWGWLLGAVDPSAALGRLW